MRLDHIAYRVFNRQDSVKFLTHGLGYKISPTQPKGFRVEFEDNTYAECSVLVPSKKSNIIQPWKHLVIPNQEYHLPPEIFVSEGSSGSIVDKWVKERKSGGIHHIAYQVDSVEKIMDEWKHKGYVEFASDEPLTCEGLVQVFTEPSKLTGIIYEFIERTNQGFCAENVRDLMKSTKDFN